RGAADRAIHDNRAQARAARLCPRSRRDLLCGIAGRAGSKPQRIARCLSRREVRGNRVSALHADAVTILNIERSRPVMPKMYQMYIDGEWVDADGGGTFEDYNPYTGEVFATVASGTRADAQRAI